MIDGWRYPKIKENKTTKYGWRVRDVDGLILGSHTDIGFGCYIQAEAGVVIDSHVQLGAYCAIYSVNTINGTRGPIHIKERARIGAHCTILPGVTIGMGAFVRLIR